MNCQAISDRLLEYVEQTLRTGEIEAVRSHLAGCDRCERERVSLIKFIGEIKQVEVDDPGEVFWHDLTASVKRSIALERKAPSRLTPRFAGWLAGLFDFTPLRAAYACAVVATVVVGLSLLFQNRLSPLEQLVHQANLSDTEGAEVFFDLMDDEGDEMDLMMDI